MANRNTTRSSWRASAASRPHAELLHSGRHQPPGERLEKELGLTLFCANTAACIFYRGPRSARSCAGDQRRRARPPPACASSPIGGAALCAWEELHERRYRVVSLIARAFRPVSENRPEASVHRRRGGARERRVGGPRRLRLLHRARAAQPGGGAAAYRPAPRGAAACRPSLAGAPLLPHRSLSPRALRAAAGNAPPRWRRCSRPTASPQRALHGGLRPRRHVHGQRRRLLRAAEPHSVAPSVPARRPACRARECSPQHLARCARATPPRPPPAPSPKSPENGSPSATGRKPTTLQLMHQQSKGAAAATPSQGEATNCRFRPVPLRPQLSYPLYAQRYSNWPQTHHCRNSQFREYRSRYGPQNTTQKWGNRPSLKALAHQC